MNAVKCPECKHEIATLVRVRSGREQCEFWPDEEHIALVTQGEFIPDMVFETYLFAKCENTVASSEKEALAFMKGGDGFAPPHNMKS